MQKIIVSVLLIFTLSFCKQKDEPDAKAAFQLNIHQTSIKLDESNIAVNENCNFILATITTSAGGEADTQFRIEFILTKSGLINKVSFLDYSDNNKKFRTADFQPAKTFSITNFVTSPTEITFDFSGELYEVGSPANNTIALSGKLNYKKYKSIDCSFYPWTVTASFDEDSLQVTEQIVKQTTSQGNTAIQYIYFTQNGFMLTVDTQEFLEQKPLGTYTFEENSDFKIRLQKYIGMVKASHITSLNEEDWLEYPCEGNIHITQQLATHTKGSFQLNAFDNNGILVYQLENGYFEIAR